MRYTNLIDDLIVLLNRGTFVFIQREIIDEKWDGIAAVIIAAVQAFAGFLRNTENQME